MSGRSAYVRKAKTKVKEGDPGYEPEYIKQHTDPALENFPTPVGARQNGYDLPPSRKESKSVRSASSDDMAYARVRRPVLPALDVSGIEKSSFRELMDKKSEGIRRGLAGISIGKKKKKNAELAESRPQTSNTIRPTHHDVEPVEIASPPTRQRSTHLRDGSSESRPGPPQGKLPPVPPPPQLKRWMGSGRTPHPWNKLRKDPELWDRNGDTLIFLAHESHQAARPPPSFRVSSHVLEATESKVLMRMLREGQTDFYSDSELPPSPISSAGGYARRGKRHYHTQPTTPVSESASQDPDGQISYELFFPAPVNQSKVDSLRYHATTRNVFALLYQGSLVGLNLLQAMTDLHERLLLYMPPEADSSELIIDYITSKGIDDARNDPSTAISLLVWSERRTVRWQEGWREFFVHCSGMHTRLDEVNELRYITPITKALLERASLEVEVRVQSVADRLVDFNFDDMWPAMQPQPPPERASFERLRQFLRGYYESSSGGFWPPRTPDGYDSWLTRDVVRRLQEDFGGLYDYLVNRDAVWEGSDERSSRKWKIVTHNPDRPIRVDTVDLPMTDILVAFDNRHRYPHIPHPYPLVPESIPVSQKESYNKGSKQQPKQGTAEEKMAERRIALAYTEATNIYILGPDFISARLVDAFVRYEKSDRASEVDPFAARRGRWVLIYGVLQALASISVDASGLRYKDDVSYHLNAGLRGTPPWKGAKKLVEEVGHENSYCWITPRSWNDSSESDVPMLDSISVSPIVSPKERSARLASSVRSSTATSATGTESDTNSSFRTSRSVHRKPLRYIPHGTVREVEHLPLAGGYGPGIERVDEWPIREESKQPSLSRVPSLPLLIKDFDDYKI